VPPGARLGAFYTCWARKEAYLKARGGGLSVPLDRFDVAVSPDAPARLLADRGDPDAAAVWALQDVDGGARFRATVAVRNSETPIRVFGTPESRRLRTSDFFISCPYQ
jgi:4'-phosphopantetheinyl transferase